MKIISVVGARPNFMKIAPFIRAIEAHNLQGQPKIVHLLVHTGQHYDERMSEAFFRDLNISAPDINLEIGSGTHAEQVGHTMIAFEKVLRENRPDWVVVVGDVNATLACAVTAKKEGVKCCHIEAGLRSGDMSMPEEINRLVTDRLSDLLLTPDRFASDNLIREGAEKQRVIFTGNIMIDTLEYNRKNASALKIPTIVGQNRLNDKVPVPSLPDRFGLITLHRPSNVDDPLVLEALLNWLCDVASTQLFFIWPIHPRTVKQAEKFDLLGKLSNCSNILLLHPVGYLEMLKLNMEATLMLTDSGGLQEECCVLGTPFLTLRWNTERPVTLLENGGAGYLVGNNIERINSDFNNLLSEKRTPKRPEFWDGFAAERCLSAIVNYHDRSIEP